jgi:hypothetical protein
MDFKMAGVTFDEFGIAEDDKLRGTRMKIEVCVFVCVCVRAREWVSGYLGTCSRAGVAHACVLICARVLCARMIPCFKCTL